MPLMIATPLLVLLSSGPCTLPAGHSPSSTVQSRSDSSGLAARPPMGWSTWTHYQRNLTAQNVLDNACALVTTGLEAKGYQFVNIDGGWMAAERDAQGNLQPDPVKFPNGMLPIAQQIHRLGLKFGIFTNSGVATGGGLPGSGATAADPQGHFAADTALFESWRFDYLKLDAYQLYVPPGETQEQVTYSAFTKEDELLRALHRPIVFSESAPAYFITEAPQYDQVLSWVGQYGQLWRTGTDIVPFDPTNPDLDQFASVVWNYTYNLPLGRFQRPGNWDDADFVIAGDPELTIPESRTQFALWSMMSAPLILGADLTQITPDALAIVGNSRVIAVDQDPLGKMSTLISRDVDHDVLIKTLLNGDAVAVFNRSDSPIQVSIPATELGFHARCAFNLQDLWTGSAQWSVKTIEAQIEPHDTGIWILSPYASCGARSQSGTIIMTVPLEESRTRLTQYAECLSSAGQVEVCSGDADETWTVEADGRLVDEHGMCLDDIGGEPMQVQCGAAPTQQWRYTEAGNLIDGSDGLCLSAKVAAENNLPSTLEVAPCGYNVANQIWSLPNPDPRLHDDGRGIASSGRIFGR
jgi:alpha-galactosidase